MAILAFLIVLAGSFFYFLNQVENSRGLAGRQEFEIRKGEGSKSVGKMLEERGLIKDDVYFFYYIWSKGLAGNILPGKYQIESLTIPEIVSLITTEQKKEIKITFPEGWTMRQMADRLSEKGFSGEEFLALSQKPGNFKETFPWLDDSRIKSLEGFLFPDTYLFFPDNSAEEIIGKMLSNFDLKFDSEMDAWAEKKGESLWEIVTLGSIIEREVKSDEDRKIVSGIFRKRMKIGQALQSCATIAYILGENKKQYSFEETRIPSPYNTYLNPGLPAGPIGNPGLSSLEASLYPEDSSYQYFLTNPETGKTIFSQTLEEHNMRKREVGL